MGNCPGCGHSLRWLGGQLVCPMCGAYKPETCCDGGKMPPANTESPVESTGLSVPSVTNPNRPAMTSRRIGPE
jgi:uncharacterized Zn finger protein (UPF0148 family)